MRIHLSVLVLLSTLTAGCDIFGTTAHAPRSTTPPVAAAPPVAAPPAVVEALACKSQGGDVYIDGTGLYRTVGDDVVLVRGVKPDSAGLCVTSAGQHVEITCFQEGGACGDSVKMEGVAGAKVPTHTPTKLVADVSASAGYSSNVSLGWLQEGMVSAKRQIAKLQGSDKKQTAALKALCAGSSDPGCEPYKEPVVLPDPAGEMTADPGLARTRPSDASGTVAARTPDPEPVPDPDPDAPRGRR